jgi:hypothetical protein
MKVGILTYHFSIKNFGAVLQTYASFQVLKKIKHEPRVINLIPGRKQDFKSKLKQFIKLYLYNNIRFEQFKKKHLHLTEPFYSNENLHELNSKFDAFYVGSDQVWRASMSKERLIHYFLDFADEEKIKISYAASFGISNWEGDSEITKQIKPLIRRFNAIGVRENDGVTICKQTFNLDATQVLDPTLLLEEEDYSKIFIKNKKFEGVDYIGYHLIQDREATGFIWKKINADSPYKLINLFGENKSLFGKKFLKFNSIEHWLYGVKNASLIVTDSFHCVIFSVIFKKNFVCVPNQHGGISRINNFLNMLGLEDRLCKSEKFDSNYYISNPVNYSLVNDKLTRYKKESLDFLEKILN